MTVINMITAVARPYNLPAMLNAIEMTANGLPVKPNWILVFDKDKEYPEYIWTMLKDAEKRIGVKILMYGGPYPQWAIPQRNMGLEAVEEGFWFPHDDDSIIHPLFFKRIIEYIQDKPDKKGFIYGQQRWDGYGNKDGPKGSKYLMPHPDKVKIYHVDSAMALIHKDLVGEERYNPEKGGLNDGDFIERIYAKHANQFFLIPEVLCYYNYLRVDKLWMSSQAYRPD